MGDGGDVRRMAHNLEVEGSDPSPATKARGPFSNRERAFCMRSANGYGNVALTRVARQSLEGLIAHCSNRCYSISMSSQPEITQRDLRMRSKEIMDAVERGQAFTAAVSCPGPSSPRCRAALR